MKKLIKTCIWNVAHYGSETWTLGKKEDRIINAFNLTIFQLEATYSVGRYLPYDTHESVPTQQRKRMVVDPFNQYQKLYLRLYELLMMGVYTRNM